MTTTLRELLAGVDERHGGTTGESRRIHPWNGPHSGWAVVRVCRCGEWSAPVMPDDSDKEAHRAHLVAEQSRAVAEWLRSDEAELEMANAILEGECITDARTALDAVAGLCGGEES